ERETRRWDTASGETRPMRGKEGEVDYRYFPDPDLVPVVHTAERVEELRATLPELPAETRQRLVDAGVAPAQAATIVDNDLTAWFDDAVDQQADAATVANWMSGDVLGQLGQAGVEPAASGLNGRHIGELVRLIDDGTLSNKLAKQVLETMVEERGERTPSAIAQQEGLEQVSDEDELQEIVDRVIEDNPDTVATIRDGNEKAIGALVGQVMKETRGQADPRLTNELLRRTIHGD
ncbi:MAG: hypothetical protein R3320_09260, partial [Nitriliruptorales bacterium]|nr:hypothetical protein [Nitriliruptorales bacterium]